jgi:dCMP deaminase
MRASADQYFMEIAKLVATRGTCVRRKVGAVLVNSRRHILATGYNGVPRGMVHCLDRPCLGAFEQSGQNLDNCLASHGEANALLQCKDVNEIDTLYVTVSPCVQCTKLLMNTSCRRIVFAELYPHEASKVWWLSPPFDREWVHLP